MMTNRYPNYHFCGSIKNVWMKLLCKENASRKHHVLRQYLVLVVIVCEIFNGIHLHTMN